MKHKMEARSLTVRLNDSILAFFQHAGFELYMPGFIDAMDVAERGCEQVSATNRIEAARHLQCVLRRRVELCGLVTDDVVLFAAHCAGLDFEHQVILREAFEQLCGNLEILLQRQIAPVEHVTCEKIRPTRGAPLLRFLDEREDK